MFVVVGAVTGISKLFCPCDVMDVRPKRWGRAKACQGFIGEGGELWF